MEVEMGDELDFLGDTIPGEQVPPGSYNVRVLDATLVDTKTGGKRIKVRFGIVGGKYSDRTVYTGFLVAHPNKSDNFNNAVKIGKRMFAELVLSCGVCHPNWVGESPRVKSLVDKGTVSVLPGPISPTFWEITGKTINAEFVLRGGYLEPKNFGPAKVDVVDDGGGYATSIPPSLNDVPPF